jgi:hypothetical protein
MVAGRVAEFLRRMEQKVVYFLVTAYPPGV